MPLVKQHYIIKLHVVSRFLVPKQQNNPAAKSAQPDKLGEHCSPQGLGQMSHVGGRVTTYRGQTYQRK
jgi:hypothetical protein